MIDLTSDIAAQEATLQKLKAIEQPDDYVRSAITRVTISLRALNQVAAKNNEKAAVLKEVAAMPEEIPGAKKTDSAE